MIFSNLSIFVFTKWKFSAIISSNIFFSAPCSLSSTSGTPIQQMLDLLTLFHGFLMLCSLFYSIIFLPTSDYSISTHPSSSSLTLLCIVFLNHFLLYLFIQLLYYFLFNTNLRFYSFFSSFLRWKPYHWF